MITGTYSEVKSTLLQTRFLLSIMRLTHTKRALPSLNAVKSFEAAARHLSFTYAAEELCVTQGAISRMVQSLESELGVQLFLRGKRNLELTEAGATYYAHVAEALDRIAASTRAIQRIDGSGGVLSISALPTFTMRWLMPRLHTFQQQHPEILVDVTTTDRIVNLSSGAIDIGIRYGLGQWPDTEATLLMHENVGVFCSPALLKNGPHLTTLADLPAHRLLQHTTRPDAWHTFFNTHDLPTPDTRQSPGFEHFFMIIEAAANGMGVALLPVFLAQAELAAGRLIQPLPQTLMNERAYYIAHRLQANRIRKIRLFKEWLIHEGKH